MVLGGGRCPISEPMETIEKVYPPVLIALRTWLEHDLRAKHTTHLEILVAPVQGGVPQEQKLLKGHLPSVICHQVY